MAVNSLGTFQFVTFHNPHDRGAPPLLPAQVGQPIQRPGVDGTTVLRLGYKAPPFQMRSGVDVATVTDACDLLAQYMASQNAAPLTVVWGGKDFETAYGVVYIPLVVEPLRIRRISAAAGGLTPGAQAWLEALWTLQPVAKYIASP